MKFSQMKKIIKIAVSFRILLFFLCIISDLIFEDYDKSALLLKDDKNIQN